MRLALLSSLFLLAAPKQPDVAAPAFWQPLPAAKPGEWLYLFPETGETLAEYKATTPNRPTETRKFVYLQPWFTRPAADTAWVDELERVAAAWFGHEVKRMPAGAMPRRAYDIGRQQYDVIKLAARLVSTLPNDALILLAITDRDLKLRDSRYAFGWGALQHRVAVMSTRRLQRGPRVRRRALGLALHEATHGLGLRHCIFFPCLMNGAHTLREADRRPLQLCPVCRAKLCWNLGLDPMRRYEALIPAFRRAGLEQDADRTLQARNASLDLLK